MDFNQKTLPKDTVNQLRMVPVESVQPFALMPSPIYVFLKNNEKFVSVKAPLDFFTEEELQQIQPMESVYFLGFVKFLMPYQTAAQAVCSILSHEQSSGELKPAGFELADSVLKAIGPLWGPHGEIEPFFATVFTEELCGRLPKDLLIRARDSSVDRYEESIMVSSWAVFLALHLGYCDLKFLNDLRIRVFESLMEVQVFSSVSEPIRELFETSVSMIKGRGMQAIRGDSFHLSRGRIGQKLVSRFERIEKNLLNKNLPVATIFGKDGFAHGSI